MLKTLLSSLCCTNLLKTAVWLLPALLIAELQKEPPLYFMLPVLIAALLLPILIFPRQIRFYIFFLAVFLYLPAWFNGAYYLLFQGWPDTSAYYALFYTNSQEAAEFVSAYLNPRLTIFSGLTLAWIVLGLIGIKPDETPYPRTLLQICFLALVIELFTGAFSFFARQSQLPAFRTADKLYELYDDEQYVTRLRQNVKDINFTDIKSIFPATEKQTYVVVIGESQTPDRMSIYGYHPRQTTPLLSRIKNELFLFDNVTSPHAATLPSLREALTFINSNNEKLSQARGSAVDYFNVAGFKTFWISNQYQRGKLDGLISLWGNAAAQSVFINRYHSDKEKMQAPYDGELLPYIEQALQDPAPRKIIFVHLMGCHADYKNRYPEEFGRFKDPKFNVPGRSDHYDNATLYNDFVISQILQKLRQTNDQTAAFLYFSDHGEDTTPDGCFCHSISMGTAEMYKIPFIVWLSDKYKEKRPDFAQSLPEKIHRPFNTRNFLHSLADLTGLQSLDAKPERSVFSDRYNPGLY